MPLDNPQYIGNLDSSNPKGTDSKTITDDSIRNFKEGMRMSFPQVKGAVSCTHQDLNLSSGLAAAGAKLLTGNAGVSVGYGYNNTAWVGWTIFEPDANVRELVIGPAAGGGAIGGSVDPTNLTQTATVTITSFSGTAAAAGDHNHAAGGLQADSRAADYNAIQGAVPFTATNTHTHTPFRVIRPMPANTHTQ